jgi:hypothetical protein
MSHTVFVAASILFKARSARNCDGVTNKSGRFSMFRLCNVSEFVFATLNKFLELEETWRIHYSPCYLPFSPQVAKGKVNLVPLTNSFVLDNGITYCTHFLSTKHRKALKNEHKRGSETCSVRVKVMVWQSHFSFFYTFNKKLNQIFIICVLSLYHQ